MKRRLTWLGHLTRLDERTPARLALKEYLKEVRRPPGRPKLTWVKLVINNLQKYSDLNLNYVSENSTFNELFILCADRQKWRSIVKHIVLQCATNMY